MRLGDKAGTLTYSAYGARVASIDAMNPVMRDEIKNRLPLYAHAPDCMLEGGVVTSWKYFKQHYFTNNFTDEDTTEFPVPQETETKACI